jgi:hypothetical protein
MVAKTQGVSIFGPRSEFSTYRSAKLFHEHALNVSLTCSSSNCRMASSSASWANFSAASLSNSNFLLLLDGSPTSFEGVLA